MNKTYLSNPASGENLLSGNLVMETGCNSAGSVCKVASSRPAVLCVWWLRHAPCALPLAPFTMELWVTALSSCPSVPPRLGCPLDQKGAPVFWRELRGRPRGEGDRCSNPFPWDPLISQGVIDFAWVGILWLPRESFDFAWNQLSSLETRSLQRESFDFNHLTSSGTRY